MPPDSPPDSRSDDPPTLVLTYDELAARLGIDPQSARRRALRSRWLKTKGNDGRARVHVPATVIPSVPATVAPTALTTVAGTEGITVAGSLIDDLRRQLSEAEARAARAEGEASGLREAMRLAEQLAQLAQADAAQAHELAQLAQGEAAQAQEDAAQARAELVGYLSLPLWRRIFLRAR